jgi:hypothetical protein
MPDRPERIQRSAAARLLLRRRELLPGLALALGGLLTTLLAGCPHRGPAGGAPPGPSGSNGGGMYRRY